MDITNISFKTYLFGFRRQLILLAISLVFLSSVIWYIYPTYVCCDAAGYWKISDDLSIMNNNPIYRTRTFAYPLLIGIARYVPHLLKLGTSLEYSFLSLLQLILHYLSVVALGYSLYASNQNKFLTSVFIYVFGLDFFLVAFTNQILSDGVAVSFLAIAIAFFIRVAISSKSSILLVMIFAFLAGLLPIIRPALFLVSANLYIMFIISYLYKKKINFVSLKLIFLSAIAFLIPVAIQTLQNPGAFEMLKGLGKFHVALGSYMYKYVTLLNPTPYGYAAFNQPMKQLIDSCEFLNQSSDCVKQVLTSHPLMTLSHYATKIFALNDQVYLTTYIHDFFTPERHVWRLINCIFLASSLLGCILAIAKAVKHISKYLFAILGTLTILISLMLPLITSVPEERFGLTFHPFFAIGTSYFFCNIFVDGKFTASNFAKIPIKIIAVFFALASSLFLFSLYIESTFGIRLNG